MKLRQPVAAKAPHFALALAFTGLSVAQPALAQSEPTADGQTSSDVGSKNRDQQIITVTARPNYVLTQSNTATKSGIALIETPQSVSIISHDQIELLQVQNLEQATRYTSGIVSGSYGPDTRFDWLTLRGFTPTQYLDGLQLPRTAIAEDQARFDTYALQEIDILKGPSSALYGAVPPGGLVDMVSKRPTDSAFGEVQGQIGNFNHYQIAGDFNGPIAGEGAVLARLVGLYRNSDTQFDYVSDKRWLIAPAIAFKLSDGLTLTLLGHYQHDLAGSGFQNVPAIGSLYPGPFGVIPRSRFVGEPNFDRYRRNEYDVGYDLRYEVSNHVTLHSKLKYTHLDVDYRTVYAFGLEPDLRTLDRYTYTVKGTPHTLATDNNVEFNFGTGGVKHQILAGFDVRHDYDNSALGYGDAPSLDVYDPVYGQPVVYPAVAQQNLVDQWQKGAYLQYHGDFGRLAITLSGREDWVVTHNRDVIYGGYSRQSDHAFSWRAGVNYRVVSGISPYFSYARSFQPTIGQSFSGQPFKSTRGEQYEAGIKIQPDGRRAFITAAVYQIKQNDALTPDLTPGHEGFSVQTGEITSRGVELEGTARINDSLSLNAAYTYTDAKTTRSNGPDLGKRLALVPTNSASALADYTIRSGSLLGLGFGAGIRYTGGVYGDSTDILKTSGFTLFDALIHYDLPHLRFALNANNVFDKRYFASCYSTDACNYGSARTILATVTARY